MGADDLVCVRCGLLVARSARGWLHIEEPPENWDDHDVSEVSSRSDRVRALTAVPTQKGFAERQAVALERIAAAVERIADTIAP